jgi:hypothetical protein
MRRCTECLRACLESIQTDASQLFADALPEYSSLPHIKAQFLEWRSTVCLVLV